MEEGGTASLVLGLLPGPYPSSAGTICLSGSSLPGLSWTWLELVVWGFSESGEALDEQEESDHEVISNPVLSSPTSSFRLSLSSQWSSP